MTSKRHLYAKVALCVVVFFLLLDGALVLLGLLTIAFVRPLILAAACVFVGAVSWEFVERSQRSDGTAGFLAWIALPLSVAAAFVSLPFFALSVYPPLEGFLVRRGVVQARFVRDGNTIELVFPGSMRHEGSNLTLDGEGIDAQRLEWRGPRTLWIQLEVGADARPRRAAVNHLPTAPSFRYLSGQAMAPEWLDLP